MKPKKTKVKSRFDKEEIKKRKLYHILEDYLLKAGYDTSPRTLNKQILISTGIITTLAIITIIILAILNSGILTKVLLTILVTTTLGFIALFLITYVLIFAYLDIKIYQRTQQIEEVLADFLQLTSANISAGMTIDRALWLAVRPRFGVLAKEIEEIAKATAAGEDLEKALMNFSKKYNSRLLKESVNLLIAGIEAGGEIGELLDKIATNIQETKLMRKEIGASVTAYSIFITAASILAAPFLFALSIELLGIVKSIASSIAPAASDISTGAISFNIKTDGLTQDDFRIFSYFLLSITAFFSAAITSVIKTGNIKSGIKKIPIFVAVSLGLFTLASLLFQSLFSGFF